MSRAASTITRVTRFTKVKNVITVTRHFNKIRSILSEISKKEGPQLLFFINDGPVAEKKGPHLIFLYIFFFIYGFED